MSSHTGLRIGSSFAIGINRDWENQFRAWGSPPGEREQTRCENTVKEIRAAAFDTALTGPKIELPRIEIIAPLLALARDGSGVDVARRFAPATPEAGVAATTAPPTAPAPTAALSTAISIAGVALSGGRVTVTDSALAKPVSHMLDGIVEGVYAVDRERRIRPHRDMVAACERAHGAGHPAP